MMSNQQIECLTFAIASSSPGGAFVQSAYRFHQILYGTLTPRIPGKILYIPGQELAICHLGWRQDGCVASLIFFCLRFAAARSATSRPKCPQNRLLCFIRRSGRNLSLKIVLTAHREVSTLGRLLKPGVPVEDSVRAISLPFLSRYDLITCRGSAIQLS